MEVTQEQVVTMNYRLNAMLISSQQLQAKVNELRNATAIRKNAPAPPDRHASGLMAAVETEVYWP